MREDAGKLKWLRSENRRLAFRAESLEIALAEVRCELIRAGSEREQVDAAGLAARIDRVLEGG